MSSSKLAAIATEPPRSEVEEKTQILATDGCGHTLIVGAGPAGVRLAHEILARRPTASVLLIGNEPYQPYNRVQLSGVLAGKVAREAIDFELPQAKQHPNFRYRIATINEIDRERQCVLDKLGQRYEYDHLVLALGSHPVVPQLENSELPGVYTFRNLKDTDALYARLASVSSVVVVGGGLLGIEAAMALNRQHTRVTLVQQSDRLMNRQVDRTVSDFLQETLSAAGIDVVLSARVSAIHGPHRVESVTLTSTDPKAASAVRQLDCGTVLFSTGVRANTQLAMRAKLAFGRGIKVDQRLQTSDPKIMAIGECAEFNGETWGLVEPGYDQAAIVADRLDGGQSEYFGSTSLARLKIIDQQICSIGDIEHHPNEPGRRELIYRSNANAEPCYRKLVVKRGVIIGAMAFGDWPEIPRIQEALINQRSIALPRQWWFRFSGQLWPSASDSDITQWPDNAIVCQCNNVSVKSLLNAVDAGANTIAEIQQCTRAATGCGSCQPLLAGLVDANASPLRERFSTALQLLSVAAIATVLLQWFMPGLTPADSVQTVAWFETVWNDKFFKQVSGFSMLGLIVLASLLSLRKRIRTINIGSYASWRLMHAALGAMAIALLLSHTGFHTGSNLNQMLLIDFLLVIGLGSATGVVISLSEHLSLSNAKRLRSFWYWSHLIAAWPLPVLLAMHITSVYYF